MTRVKEWITSSYTESALYGDWNPYFYFLGPLEDGDTLLRIRATCSMELKWEFDSGTGNPFPEPWFPFQTVLTFNWKTGGVRPTGYFEGGDVLEDYLWVSQVNWNIQSFTFTQGTSKTDGVYCLNTEDSRLIDTKSERLCHDDNSGPWLCIDTQLWEETTYPYAFKPVIQHTVRMLVEHAD